MGQILANVADYEMVRASLGITNADLSNDSIGFDVFLGRAEAKLRKQFAKQVPYEVATVATIMAYLEADPLYDDRINLRAACTYYIAALFTTGEPNAVDTSIEQGEIVKDLGGVGIAWERQGELYVLECVDALREITNWRQYARLPES